MPLRLRRALSTVLACSLAACGGSYSDQVTNPPGGTPAPTTTLPVPTGTLTVEMTDAPFDFETVLVTFSDLAAERAASATFVSLPFAGGAQRTCNLLRLGASRAEVFASGTLPEDHYNALRLRITGGFVDLDDSTPLPACAPSIAPPRGAKPLALAANAHEVVINRDFDIKAGATTTIRLDFDISKSISRSGSGAYVLRPVIRVDSVTGP